MDAMYERFFDDEQEENGEQVVDEDNHTDEDLTIQQEKQKELVILEKILGRKMPTSADPIFDKKKNDQPNYLVRYDPTNPDHQQFEIKPTQVETNPKKRKRKNAEEEEGDKKRKEEEQPVEVSKEKFYKVTENLKEALQDNQSFSFLSAFGQKHNEENEQENQGKEINAVEALRLTHKEFEKNPFRYDSSDEEDDEKCEFNTNNTESTSKAIMNWNESFFFQRDDYRFQEGMDFVQKIMGQGKDKGEFLKLRGQLKKIIKAKVKNATKKDKLFKNKIANAVGKKHKLHGKKHKFIKNKRSPKRV